MSVAKDIPMTTASAGLEEASPAPPSFDGGDAIDPDILLDMSGLRDLDAAASQENMRENLKKHVSSSSLGTLNERMTDQALDDACAFQHVRPATASRDELDGEGGGSVDRASADRRKALRESPQSSRSLLAAMPCALNTLDEGEEGADDDGAGGEGTGDAGAVEGGGVLLSQMSMISRRGAAKENSREFSTKALAAPGSNDELEEEEEDASVDVPTDVMQELKLANTRRNSGHSSYNASSAALAGMGADFLEPDEMDGLDADLASLENSSAAVARTGHSSGESEDDEQDSLEAAAGDGAQR